MVIASSSSCVTYGVVREKWHQGWNCDRISAPHPRNTRPLSCLFPACSSLSPPLPRPSLPDVFLITWFLSFVYSFDPSVSLVSSVLCMFHCICVCLTPPSLPPSLPPWLLCISLSFLRTLGEESRGISSRERAGGREGRKAPRDGLTKVCCDLYLLWCSLPKKNE